MGPKYSELNRNNTPLDSCLPTEMQGSGVLSPSPWSNSTLRDHLASGMKTLYQSTEPPRDFAEGGGVRITGGSHGHTCDEDSGEREIIVS